MLFLAEFYSNRIYISFSKFSHLKPIGITIIIFSTFQSIFWQEFQLLAHAPAREATDMAPCEPEAFLFLSIHASTREATANIHNHSIHILRFLSWQLSHYTYLSLIFCVFWAKLKKSRISGSCAVYRNNRGNVHSLLIQSCHGAWKYGAARESPQLWGCNSA